MLPPTRVASLTPPMLLRLLLATALSLGSAFVAPVTRVAAPLGARGGAAAMADELSLLESMSGSFYATKRARLEAELAARLAELEEFEARERALALSPGGPAASSDLDLLAALEEERARSASLEAQLLQSKLDQEVAVQKVAAFWIGKVEEAKGTAALAPAADDAATAAPAAAAQDLVPDAQVVEEVLDPTLSLRELRARLLSYGLSTSGTKGELRTRLEYAMLHGRQQYKSWDPVAQAWN